MKLHLPSSLRKALLACIAAFPALLPSTLASGAILLGSSCSFALASEPADDEEEGIMPYAEETEWTWTNPGNVGWADTPSTISDRNITFTLESEGEAPAQYAYKLYGNGSYTVEGGKKGDSLKLDKSGGATNSTELRFGEMNISHLWLTNTNGTTQYDNNFFTIADNDTYIAGLSTLENLYINHVGVQLGTVNGNVTQKNVSWSTNLILGAPGSKTNLSNNSLLYIGNWNISTTGYLEASVDTKIAFRFNLSGLAVSDLRGNGNLELSTDTAANPGAQLTLRQGGENYGGRLIFSENCGSMMLFAAGRNRLASLHERRRMPRVAGLRRDSARGHDGAA